MLKKQLVLFSALLFFVTSSHAAIYQIDASHTQIHFKIAHLMVFKVRGTFDDFSGSIDIDEPGKTLTSASATIQIESIDTGNEKRDNHLRSGDFFDVDKYPTITFNSREVAGSGDMITVVGDLTIKDVTREVTLRGKYLGSVTDPWGNSRAGFEATGMIDRREFGLTYNKALETGGVLIGDKVEIGLEVEAVKQK